MSAPEGLGWDPEQHELVLVPPEARDDAGARLELGHRRFVQKIREREEAAGEAAGARA